MKKSLILFLSSIVFFAAFSGPSSSQTLQRVKDMYPLPAIPDSLDTRAERADYLVRRFWDNYNFSDTALLRLPFLTEQAVVDFLDVLPSVAYDRAEEALKNLVSKSEAAPQTFEHITGLLEKYLYHPASPLRNDEFYIPVLEAMIESEIPSETEKTVLRYRLANASKNRVGTTAADFRYTTENGKTRRMHKLESEYTLLMFYNPDCHTCEDATRTMINSQAIKKATAAGRLTILAIFADDDSELWKKHVRRFPSSWINGYNKDGKITKEELYDIRTIPTFFLLDDKKNVILKDAALERIEDALSDSGDVRNVDDDFIY